MIDEITHACVQWEKLCYDDNNTIHDLITDEYKSGHHRGLHKSARNAKHITSVFWLGLGWLDMDYNLAKQIKEKFELKVKLNKRKMDWIKK